MNRTWIVRFKWNGKGPFGQSAFEAGMDTEFPEGTSIMEVLRVVAETRNVDLSQVTSAVAEMDPYNTDRLK